jgi:hypothetical protein
MWVRGHAGIQGNEKADQRAKAALQEETNQNYKTVAEDWNNWIREKQEEIRQAEWTSFDNTMVTVKPRVKKKNGAQMRRDQVIISRLQLTHGTGWTLIHSSNVEIVALGSQFIIYYSICDCPTYRRQIIECNISKETLSGDKDEIRRLIRYVQEIRVYHDI